MNNNDQTIAGYDKTVEKYLITSPQVVSHALKAWIDKNLGKLTVTAKILELGSGTGKDSAYFAAQGFNMELTDASQGFVDYLNTHGKQARFLNALTDNLGSDYGMVFANAVLLHFNPDQVEIVLSKIYRALIPQGRVVFSLKIGSGDELTDRKLDVPRYFCYWNEADITKLLTATGFTNIEIECVDDYRGKAKHGWLLIDAEKAKI